MDRQHHHSGGAVGGTEVETDAAADEEAEDEAEADDEAEFEADVVATTEVDAGGPAVEADDEAAAEEEAAVEEAAVLDATGPAPEGAVEEEAAEEETGVGPPLMPPVVDPTGPFVEAAAEWEVADGGPALPMIEPVELVFDALVGGAIGGDEDCTTIGATLATVTDGLGLKGSSRIGKV